MCLLSQTLELISLSIHSTVYTIFTSNRTKINEIIRYATWPIHILVTIDVYALTFSFQSGHFSNLIGFICTQIGHSSKQT